MNIKKLRKIEPVQRMTNAKVGGHKVVALNFPVKNYSREDIQELVRLQQERYKGKSLRMMVSLKLDRGYRSSKGFYVDRTFKLDLYGEESDTTDHFVLYIWKDGKK